MARNIFDHRPDKRAERSMQRQKRRLELLRQREEEFRKQLPKAVENMYGTLPPRVRFGTYVQLAMAFAPNGTVMCVWSEKDIRASPFRVLVEVVRMRRIPKYRVGVRFNEINATSKK